MAFSRSRLSTLSPVLVFVLCLSSGALARVPANLLSREDSPPISAASPAYCAAEHHTGEMAFTVTNYGLIGTGLARSVTDCFTGAQLHSCEFPKGSNKEYLFFGSIWIGAVVGGDTLVSTGADGWVIGSELHPDESPFGDMRTYSTLDTTLGWWAPEAVSHRDFVAVYTDTYTSGVTGLVEDEIDHRPHQPLNVEVTQKTYSWGSPGNEDFVLLEYQLKNIGDQALAGVYLGLLVDGDVWQDPDDAGHQDDITGYRPTVPVTAARCAIDLDLPTGWIADNDGDMTPSLHPMPLVGVSALTLLQAPVNQPTLSYNWWGSHSNACLDYGPQMREHLRDLGYGGLGTPAGDRNKYAFMSNGEIDFDYVYTAGLDSLDPVWVSPLDCGTYNWDQPGDVRYLLSVGPVDLLPGQTAPYYFTYTVGDHFHVDSLNWVHNMRQDYDPDSFTDGLSFSDLNYNIQNAYWMFDLPGVDTDSDGYFGQYLVCSEDTIFFTGDGIPDLVPGRTVTAYHFLRAWPPDNSNVTGDSVTFTWSSCPSRTDLEFYELSVKVGGITVTLTDVQDTSVTIGLRDKALKAGPTQVEWWVTARSRPQTFATRDGHGSFVYDVITGIEPPIDNPLPVAFSLEQNYPNPFNPTTQIEFALPQQSFVRLEIINIAGQRVKTVLSGQFPAGVHTAVWDGSTDDGVAAASGVYFYRLTAGDYQSTRKMVLTR